MSPFVSLLRKSVINILFSSFHTSSPLFKYVASGDATRTSVAAALRKGQHSRCVKVKIIETLRVTVLPVGKRVNVFPLSIVIRCHETSLLTKISII